MSRPTKKQVAEYVAKKKREADEEHGYVVKPPKPQAKDVAWAASFMNALEPPPVIRNPD